MIPKTTFIKKKTLSEDFCLRNDKNVKGIMTPNSHETAENLYTKHSNVHRLPPPKSKNSNSARVWGLRFPKKSKNRRTAPGVGSPGAEKRFWRTGGWLPWPPASAACDCTVFRPWVIRIGFGSIISIRIGDRIWEYNFD